MGLINWLMHRTLRNHAEEIAKQIGKEYSEVKLKAQGVAETELLRTVANNILNISRWQDKEKANKFINLYCDTIEGLAYYIGLNVGVMKGNSVGRCLQFIEYLDIALKQNGFKLQSPEQKTARLKHFGLIQKHEIEADHKIILTTGQPNTEKTEDVDENHVNKEYLPESLANINKLLSIRSGNVLELLDAKVEVLTLMHKTDEAVQTCNHILEIDSRHANAYIALATIYQMKAAGEGKDYATIIVELLQKLEKIEPEKVSYYVLAGALEDKGDVDEALRIYQKAILQEQNNDNSSFLESIYSSIAKILTKQKKYPEAIAAYTTAIEYSIKEFGDDSFCFETYAFMRALYALMGDFRNTNEMEGKFSAAEKLHTKKSPAFHDEKLASMYKSLNKLGVQERATTSKFYDLVLLELKIQNQNQDIWNTEVEKVIDSVLADVEYDKDTRAIEKMRLINRIRTK